LLYRLALTGFLDLSFKKKIPDANNLQKMGRCVAEEILFTKYQAIIERALLLSRR
jgi:hypothetical protein